jgi:hypothetical protein
MNMDLQQAASEQFGTTDLDSLTSRQIETLADGLLREDARSELCRECEKRGDLTGNVTEGEVVDFPEYSCKNGHTWYAGEGAVRGIGGENPILFEEHFQSRRRREIFTSLGTPDPSIVQGMYNRVHPQGRKVNSSEQRQKNGASFYRG